MKLLLTMFSLELFFVVFVCVFNVSYAVMIELSNFQAVIHSFCMVFVCIIQLPIFQVKILKKTLKTNENAH